MSTYTSLLDLLKKNPLTEGSDTFNITTMLNDNWDKIDGFLSLLTASVAPVYSATSAYAVGAYCTHGGQLYQCTTAIGSGGESWNASHWTAKSTTELIAAVRNAIPTVPSASSTTPKMDGTAAVGTGTTWARADHVHPTDTGRAASSHNHAASAINSGTLGVARGGTGKSSVTANSFLVGNGTSAMAEKTAAQVLALLGAAQIASGTYSGTGTYGSSNKTSLTFNFAPKALFITGDGYQVMMMVPSTTEQETQCLYRTASGSSGDAQGAYLQYRLSTKTVSWYCTNAPSAQMNASGKTYSYIALG